jgi:hypothetical protein
LTAHDYEQVAGELMVEARRIEDAKRPGYTRGDEDVLSNFKRAATNNRISPEAAWGVFFDKHLDAIKAAMLQPDLPLSEPILGRFADAVNYLRLGYGLYVERQRGQP